MDNQDGWLTEGDYKTRGDAIINCAIVAASRGYRVFAVHDGGLCRSSSEAHLIYDKNGPSLSCRESSGKGTIGAMDVYLLHTKGNEPCTQNC